MNDFRSYKLSKQSDELRALILANPDLPIVVIAGEEANGGDYSWMFCSSIHFTVEEILDCDYTDHGDTVFVDRDRLEEKVEEDLYEDYYGKPDEEYQAAVKNRLAELEPYWTKVIAIYATN